jgi:hypothetical protein
MQNHIGIAVLVHVQVPDKSSGSKQSSVNKTNAKYPLKRKILEIRLSTSHFDLEEFAMYRRYQTKVHKDKTVRESSYKRFLVDTPLVVAPPPPPQKKKSGDNTVPPCGFGSFHQQDRIDGKLVAVGVVDILPKCLSSKYLFWDPDHSFLSLGKYTALKEIDWVKKTQQHRPRKKGHSSVILLQIFAFVFGCTRYEWEAHIAQCPVERVYMALKSNFLHGHGFTLKRRSGDSVRLNGLKLKENAGNGPLSKLQCSVQ